MKKVSSPLSSFTPFFFASLLPSYNWWLDMPFECNWIWNIGKKCNTMARWRWRKHVTDFDTLLLRKVLNQSIFKSRFTVINFENSIEITLIQFWLLCLHYRISQSRNNIRHPLQKFTRLSIPIEVEAEVQFFSIRSSPLNCTAVNLLTIFRIGEKLFIYHSIYFPVLSPTDY